MPQESNWGAVRAKFQEDGSVQLQNFLSKDWAAQVAAAVAAADEADALGRGRVPAYDAGMAGGWQAVGPCHKQRYLRYAPGAAAEGQDGADGSAQAAAGGALQQIREELFGSAAFARLLTQVREAAT